MATTTTTSNPTALRTSGFPGFSTTFVGREAEISSITQLLERAECRLLTIIGPGGAGKTRLAAEVATRLGGDETPRYFIDMATASSGDAAARRIARAFDVSIPRIDGDGETVLAEALRDKAAVAVVDNFEHLVETCAEAIGVVAAQCPEIRFIITSRVALNVQQEWRFNLEGLAVEGKGGDGARQLFVDRASRVSGRKPGDFDDDAVRKICESVDGLPLAIEMAAGWTRSLHEADIATELQRRLDLLMTSMRDLPERQRSMEAVFDQSFMMLDPQAAQVFIRLGVFTGGFTRGAAVDVAGASLPLLATLVDHSMVSVEPGGRYRLHPLLRQYARNALVEANLGEEMNAKHCRYYVSYMERQLNRVRGSEQPAAIQEMNAELGNMAQAWRLLPGVIEAGWIDDVLRAASASGLFMEATARYQDSLLFSNELVLLAPLAGDRAFDVELLGRSMRAGINIRVGDLDEAEADLEIALALEREYGITGDWTIGQRPGPLLPLVYLVRGEYARAAKAAVEAERLALPEDNWSRGIALYCQGGAHFGMGEYGKARASTLRALDHMTATGERWLGDYLHLQMAECGIRQGAYDEAESHADSALRSRVAFEDRQGQAHALLRLGDIAAGRGLLGDARERYLQALKLYREISDKGGRALAQVSLAKVDAAEGDPASARARYLRALEIVEPMAYAPALAEIFLGVAEVQVEAGDGTGAAAALAFLRQWENAPLAVKREAEALFGKLALKPAAVAEVERQGKALSVEALCRAIERTLRSTGNAAVPLAPGEGELTRRELQVLALLDRGYTNSAVAKELGLTLSTVKWYCTQIFAKLGAPNRTAALAKARRSGLIA
jgi:predicted ATPase/DNA-binding CsgD family transcriptional regulator